MLWPLMLAELTVGGGGEPESTDMGLGDGSHSSPAPVRSLPLRERLTGLGLGDEVFMHVAAAVVLL